MKWYTGNIAEAVQKSKQIGAVFFVAIFGDDVQSKRLEEAVESSDMQALLSSEHYVCIRLTADSQEHQQFKEIYSNAESPCVYFISLMGAPVEIIHGEATVSDLQQRCESAWSKHSKVLQCQKPAVQPDVQATAAQTQAAPVGRRETTPVPSGSREATPVAAEDPQDDAGTANLTLEERVERARQLAATRAQLKLEEEAEEQRKREKERREAGKGVAELKRWQDEQEAKRLVEERKREKREDDLLRQRLREQIAQDRAERNKRTNASIVYEGTEPSPSNTAPKLSVASTSSTNYAGKARLQFRMPDGSSFNNHFDQDVTLGHVRKFLSDGQHVKFSNFSLCLAFPRREFTSSEYDQSLKTLGLIPSAALLVIPAGGRVLSAAGGSTGASGLWLFITSFLGYILYPITYLFGMIQRALPSSSNTQSPPSNPSGSSANRGEHRLGGSGTSSTQQTTTDKLTPGSSASSNEEIRKRNVKTEKKPDGNIHRLRNQETDSDDDLGTWNGNSTQQKPR